MTEEWVSCSDLYQFLSRNGDTAGAGRLIQTEGQAGNIEARARKAIFAKGSSASAVSRERDWLIPPRVWLEPLRPLTGIQTEYRFDPSRGTIEALGFTESDLRLPSVGAENIDDRLIPVWARPVLKLFLSHIEVNGLDAADLGFQRSPESTSRPEGRGRRTGVGGYDKFDQAIIDKMKARLVAGEATSPTSALSPFLADAQGASDKAKTDRIVAKFYERFPDWSAD